MNGLFSKGLKVSACVRLVTRASQYIVSSVSNRMAVYLWRQTFCFLSTSNVEDIFKV